MKCKKKIVVTTCINCPYGTNDFYPVGRACTKLNYEATPYLPDQVHVDCPLEEDKVIDLNALKEELIKRIGEYEYSGEASMYAKTRLSTLKNIINEVLK